MCKSIQILARFAKNLQGSNRNFALICLHILLTIQLLLLAAPMVCFLLANTRAAFASQGTGLSGLCITFTSPLPHRVHK